MTFFDNILLGFQVFSDPSNILCCAIGVLVGTLVGVLPGIGPQGAMALLLPATFRATPTGSIIMLAGIYYGAPVRGLNDLDTGQYSGRADFPRHVPGRLPDGPPGESRPRPGYSGVGFLHRGDGGGDRAHGRSKSPRAARPELRASRDIASCAPA